MTATDRLASAADHRQAGIRSLLARLCRRLVRWYEHSRQYGDLAELDDERLRDIGLTFEDVRRVRSRWFRR